MIVAHLSLWAVTTPSPGLSGATPSTVTCRVRAYPTLRSAEHITIRLPGKG